MAKTKISEYSSTSAGANLNTDINNIDIDEGCAPSGINNAIRTLMAQVKDFQTGVSGDGLTLGGALSGTSATFSGNVTASAISGASLTLSGNITASAISGASMTLSGDLTVDTNTLYVNSSNNRVGIGESSPNAELHITDSAASAVIRLESADTGEGVINFDDQSATNRGRLVYDHTDNSMQFYTNGLVRGRFDSSGNVGIGTSSPVTKIDFGSSVANVGQIINTYTSGNYRAGIGMDSATAAVRIYAPTVDPVAIFGHVSNTDGSTFTERMRIDSSGKLLVACTSSTSLGTQTGASNVSTFNQSGITLTAYGVVAGFYYDRLNFTNSQYYIVNSSSVGVYLGNGSTSWTSTSDERLKNITGNIENAIDAISTLRAVKFTWNNDKENKPQVGLIAQDIQKVLPEVISEDNEGYLGVRYTETIPLLVKAIQEQQDIIKALETRIQALENK